MSYLAANNLKSVTVAECLGDFSVPYNYAPGVIPPTFTEAAPLTGPTACSNIVPKGSIDTAGDTCGGSTGFICATGQCCSA
jgi:hypothetical protein